MSIGTTLRPESLGTPPANVALRPYVPQLQVLSRAAAFVTHGGMNSVSESLAFGVPLVTVPQMSEQLVVGRRVEDLGAGLFLAPEAVSAETLRNAIRRVRADAGYRRAAATIGDSFRAAGGVRMAVDAIERFVR
jgi:MGT family glycosyltransferase